MRGAKIEDEECCESSSSKRLSRSSSSCTSSNSSSSGSSSHKNNANGKNTNMRRWYDPNSQSVHEGCRCSCQQQRQDDAIHLVTTTTATATGTAAAAGSKRRGGVVDLCSRSKAMKLESEEEDEEEHEEQMLEEEHEEREEEDRLLQEDEDDAHTVPVFAGQEDQENSPASGVVDGEAEMESEMGAEMQPEDDPMDVERFLNCELDEDPCEEQHSNVAAAAAATTPTTTIDLEFLGLCCDHDQALCDEDFAIRKNTIASSSPAACDYGEVDDLISFSLPLPPPPPPPRVIPPTTIEPAEEDDPFWKLMQQQHVQRRIWLRLDYEDVLNAWPDRRPFVSENASAIAIANAHRSKQEPPQFQSIRRPKAASAVPEDSTSDIAGSSDVGVVPELSSGSVGAQSVDQVHRVPVVSTLDDHGRRNQQQCCSGEGREARVSRYREKRRTRLFSKKIRYEVRKLNAERRPRLKGRFVKRSTDGGED